MRMEFFALPFALESLEEFYVSLDLVGRREKRILFS